MSHFVEICKECRKIVSQCRCPAKDKNVVEIVCPECRRKIAQEAKVAKKVEES